MSSSSSPLSSFYYFSPLATPDRSSSSNNVNAANNEPINQQHHDYHNPILMERVLFTLHYQICTHVERYMPARVRNVAERVLLVLAVCGFGALWLAHLSFVYRGGSSAVSTGGGLMFGNHNVPLRCLASVSGFSRVADITHIRLILNEAMQQGEGRRTQEACCSSRAWMAITETQVKSSSFSFEPSRRDEAISCSVVLESENSVAQDESRASFCDAPKTTKVLFSFSPIKGYLLLPSDMLSEMNLTVQEVAVSKADTACFGEPFLQSLVFGSRWIGMDTVIQNWFLGEFTATGYLYNPRTDALLDLNSQFYSHSRHQKNEQPAEETATTRFFSPHSTLPNYWTRLYGSLLSKLVVVGKTSFLFFVTTTLTSFTLRETQERMLTFTQQLRQEVRAHHSVAGLVARHLAQSLIFVPGLVGLVFFLIEFYRGDRLLAFLVVSLVWFAEVFSLISLRSSQGMRFFPKKFFLLFCLFHFYLFSYPFGFSYTAFAAAVCFMTHSMFFFWQRYELPAVALGLVNAQHPRRATTSVAPAAVAAMNSVTFYGTTAPSVASSTTATATPSSQPASSSQSTPVTPLRQRESDPPSNPSESRTTEGDAPTSSMRSRRQQTPAGGTGSAPSVPWHERHDATHVSAPQTPEHSLQRASRTSNSMNSLSVVSSTSSFGSICGRFARPAGATRRLSDKTDTDEAADDDDGSYMYFMGGEVVMRSHQNRRRSGKDDSVRAPSADESAQTAAASSEPCDEATEEKKDPDHPTDNSNIPASSGEAEAPSTPEHDPGDGKDDGWDLPHDGTPRTENLRKSDSQQRQAETASRLAQSVPAFPELD